MNTLIAASSQLTFKQNKDIDYILQTERILANDVSFRKITEKFTMSFRGVAQAHFCIPGARVA